MDPEYISLPQWEKTGLEIHRVKKFCFQPRWSHWDQIYLLDWKKQGQFYENSLQDLAVKQVRFACERQRLGSPRGLQKAFMIHRLCLVSRVCTHIAETEATRQRAVDSAWWSHKTATPTSSHQPHGGSHNSQDSRENGMPWLAATVTIRLNMELVMPSRS